MTTIVLTNSSRTAENLIPEYTVEAEYGSTVVEGTKLTLAHHADGWGHNPAPCLGTNFPGTRCCPWGADSGESCREGMEMGCEDECLRPIPYPKRGEVVLVSHFDLDTLGGVLRVLGRKPHWGNLGFWRAAAAVDTAGPHRLGKILVEEVDEEFRPLVRRRLQAFWAWSEANRLFAPRDGSSLDVTDYFSEAEEALRCILSGDEGLLAAGDTWAATKKALAKESYLEMVGDVVVRTSDSFVNHLYEASRGRVARAVVALNTRFNSVTVSLETPVKGVSACKLVQDLWGSEAGGHTGIAGSPRGKEMTLRDAYVAAGELAIRLQD